MKHVLSFITGVVVALVFCSSAQADTPPINYLFNSPLVRTGNTVSCNVASTSIAGCLSAASFNIFNNKQNALGFTPVNKAGDTMTGLLVLSADPTLPLGAATKQYVDAIPAGANLHLSNITAPTNIPIDLLPDSLTLNENLGSTAQPWNGVYAEYLHLDDLSGSYTELDSGSSSFQINYSGNGTTVYHPVTANANGSMQFGATGSTDVLVNQLQVWAGGEIDINTNGLNSGIAISTGPGTSESELFLTKNEINFQGDASGVGMTAKIYDGQDFHYVGLQGPASMASAYTLILPAAQGGANTFLQNDGAGNLAWASASVTTGNLTSPTTGVLITGGTGAVVGTGTTVSIQNATAAQPGLLTAADFTTFNNKQATGLTVLKAGDTMTGTLTTTGILDSGLSASQAVVTDASKNLASLAYATTNTVSTLVERDGSGNFSAGTITAALTGAASSNVLKAGDTMTSTLNINNSSDVNNLKLKGSSGQTSDFFQILNSTGTVLAKIDSNGNVFGIGEIAPTSGTDQLITQFGTIVNPVDVYWEKNHVLCNEFSGTTGTLGASTVQFQIPASKTIDTAKYPQQVIVGEFWRYISGAALPGSTVGVWPLFFDPTDGYITIALNWGTGTSKFVNNTAASAFIGAGGFFTGKYCIAVTN